MEAIKKAYIREGEYFKTKIMRPAAFCMAAFLAVAVLYYAASVQDIAAAKKVFDEIGRVFEEKGFLGEMTNLELFWAILNNNALAGFLILITGAIPFIFSPFWGVVSNAALAGIVVAVMQDAGSGVSDIFISLMPHGIVELPAFFFTAGLGLRVCWVATKKVIGRGKGLSFKGEFWRAWESFIAVALPLFVLAALIEAFVTVNFVK